MSLDNKRILLIISGGIAAYKSLELIRLIKKSGGAIKCILTNGGAQFVTPLSISALSNEKCYTDLWSIDDEMDMGHIQLSRWADMVVVAPASADIMAKMAHGMANDLATTCLLASNKPIMVAPAMNPMMWDNAATQENIATLTKRDIHVINPNCGDMACGETGQGRMVEASEILKEIARHCEKATADEAIQNVDNGPGLPRSLHSLAMTGNLNGKHAIVTSGPTHEPIDPVRYIGNRSSGKQGHAIACALRDAGATVTLISGPTALSDPDGMTVTHVETAQQMMDAVETALPVDIAVCAAAVADYGVQAYDTKQKKSDGVLDIKLTDNPDILKTLSTHSNRPEIVIGFAAETDDVVKNAKEKILRKGCDIIIANEVGTGKVFAQDTTSAHWISKTETNAYPDITKAELATIIVQNISDMIKPSQKEKIA